MKTAIEFFENRADELGSDYDDMPQWMIECAVDFAREHLKLATTAICGNVKIVSGGMDEEDYVSEDSIIEAYPLTNIQ